RHKNTVFLNTLAVAYASASRFDDAISTAEQALDLAESAGNERLSQKLKGRIKLFKEALSHIEKPPIKDNISE
ncbi:MAG: hypothetical protein ACYSN8_06540, partial [Planctomycetota bacterium]